MTQIAETLIWHVTDAPKARLDKALADYWEQYSRSTLKKWLEQGLVVVNGAQVKAKTKLKAGDVVALNVPKAEPLALTPQNIALDIVYEDDQVIVVNKPQGMVVHPAPGHPDGTLVNALLYHCPLAQINNTLRPGIVHRIDKDTSGLLMVAKTDTALARLSAQLKAKTNKRIYLAIVHGNFASENESGTIDAPLGRSKTDRKKQAIVANGRHAVTHYRVLEQFMGYSLVECQLETGRTHQIRVHMKSINHPLAGDPLYGPKKTLPGNGQFLHAAVLGFTHPTSGKWLEFACEPPKIFQTTLEKLRRQR